MANLERITASRNQNYKTIATYIFEDANISGKAKAIFGYIMTRPENWTIWMKDVESHMKEGRDAVQKAMKELSSAGYVVKKPNRVDGGRVSGWVYTLVEKPSVTTDPLVFSETVDSAHRIPENPSDGKTDKRFFQPYNNKDLVEIRKKTNTSSRKIEKKEQREIFDDTDLSLTRRGNGESSREEKENDKQKLEKTFRDLRDIFGHTDRFQFTPNRRKKLQTRLKNNSAKDLILAAEGMMKSGFMRGEENGKKFATIDCLLRSDEKIDFWIEQEQGGFDLKGWIKKGQDWITNKNGDTKEAIKTVCMRIQMHAPKPAEQHKIFLDKVQTGCYNSYPIPELEQLTRDYSSGLMSGKIPIAKKSDEYQNER